MRSIPCCDFYETALWRATRLTHLTFMACIVANGSYLSELFNLPGFIFEFITADLMHCGELGVLLYLEGIVLWELLMEIGGSLNNNKEQLN